MSISVLHILAPAAVGGLERVVHALACGHAARGHTVQVAAIVDGDEEDHPYLELLRESGVRVIARPFPGRRYLHERREIAALIRDLQPEVVHTHGYRADVLSGSAAQSLGLPTVTTVHGFTGGDWKNRVYEWLQLRAFRRFACVVAVSRPIVTRLVESGVPAPRIRMLRNAWRGSVELDGRDEARAALGLDPDTFTIGWVGRLSREKGADVYLEAIAHLSPREPWQAAVIGDGRERARLQERTARPDLEGRVRWCGVVPDAARSLRAFDVLVLSSRTEGTPIVLLEAMAAGVPVVATAVGGVPDVVSPEEALLVPPEDPAALASAIAEVRDQPAAAAARASSAVRRLARDFAADPWLDAYEEVYHAARVSTGRQTLI